LLTAGPKALFAEFHAVKVEFVSLCIVVPLAEIKRHMHIAGFFIEIFPECVGLTAEDFCGCIASLLSTK
jgi:hypothetical protein